MGMLDDIAAGKAGEDIEEGLAESPILGSPKNCAFEGLTRVHQAYLLTEYSPKSSQRELVIAAASIAEDTEPDWQAAEKLVGPDSYYAKKALAATKKAFLGKDPAIHRLRIEGTITLVTSCYRSYKYASRGFILLVEQGALEAAGFDVAVERF